MADVPISDALIDSAQFQVQSVEPATPGAGLVRLFRGEDGWKEKREDGTAALVSPAGFQKAVVTVTSAQLLAIHDVPVTLVPGKADHFVYPVALLGALGPGTSYGAGIIQIGGGYVAGTVFYWSFTAPLTRENPQIFAFDNNGVTSIDDIDVADVVGLPLLLTGTGNPATGTRDMILTVFYSHILVVP